MRMRICLVAGLVLVVASFPAVLAAQEHLAVTVGVSTAAGAPLAGLSQSDFSLLESGKPRSIDSFRAATGGQFPPEAIAQIKELGFQLKRSIEVPSKGQYTLHLVLYDNQTGRIGSLSAPMTIQ